MEHINTTLFYDKYIFDIISNETIKTFCAKLGGKCQIAVLELGNMMYLYALNSLRVVQSLNRVITP